MRKNGNWNDISFKLVMELKWTATCKLLFKGGVCLLIILQPHVWDYKVMKKGKEDVL